ncbi:hypothetical protein [Paenirhodobacter populi]|uniref:hypothetical protein n=1 Tax=Paenirhodobacter populi TaxID=2306993 RepID=UPI000FE51298|nr:hypothetical protein [Sinirhodobacter populi]RWR05257.1 hypothetical protein D2T32_17525 [Sinirhodobacter populi]
MTARQREVKYYRECKSVAFVCPYLILIAVRANSSPRRALPDQSGKERVGGDLEDGEPVSPAAGAMDVIASRMHHADVVMEVGDTFFEAQCTAAKLRLLCIRTIFEASARALGFFRCESRQHDCGNR